MTIIPYDHSLRSQFEQMLVTYFIDDLHSDIPEDIIRGKLMEHITGYVHHHITYIAIALEGDTPIGFSIYQIDSPESDWCKRPGWGFIREFHIAEGYRGQGFGNALAAYTEQQLRSLGAVQLYLTSDSAAGFWEKLGWHSTQEICSNDLEILTK